MAIAILHQSSEFFETNPTSVGEILWRKSTRKWAPMESRRFRWESVLGNRHSQTFPFLTLTSVQNRDINTTSQPQHSNGPHMWAVCHGIS